MANGLYQTEGIILNSADQGEADKFLTVFTKEFGMLRLFARGTRRSSSKLNKFLNIFSHGRFGFVSGRDSWHLIDAEDLDHYDLILTDEGRHEILGRIASFVSRFHAGETKDRVMFGLLRSALQFLGSIDKNYLEDFELTFRAKALLVMGYLSEEEMVSNLDHEEREKIDKILLDTSFKNNFPPFDSKLRELFRRHIEAGSASSHL